MHRESLWNLRGAKVWNSEELQYGRITQTNIYKLPRRIDLRGQKRIQSKCHLRSQWERVLKKRGSAQTWEMPQRIQGGQRKIFTGFRR